MKVFRLTNTEQEPGAADPSDYFGTLGEVKAACREIAQPLRKQHVVEELDVQSDKAGMVAALNGTPIITDVIRTFSVTARGALAGE
jgi:hypothetical protein